MKVKNIGVNDIRVGNRVLKEIGSIIELADNIHQIGLIHPITVMQEDDGKYLLLAGFRRLQAMRALRKKKIRANVLPKMDRDRQLMIEIAENEQCKGLTYAEKLECAECLKEIEAGKAKRR